MKRMKVITLIDERLFRRAKLEAARQRKQISVVFGQALERYLAENGSRAIPAGAVDAGWGVLKLDRHTVHRLLREEGVCLTLNQTRISCASRK